MNNTSFNRILSLEQLSSDVLQIVYKHLSLNDLAQLRATNNFFFNDTKDTFHSKYNELFLGFQECKSYFFDIMITNFFDFTINLQASLYFEFLEKILILFKPVLIFNKQVVSDIFHYIQIFFKSLNTSEINHFKELCLREIAHYLYVDSTINTNDIDKKEYITILFQLLDNDIYTIKYLTSDQIDQILSQPYYKQTPLNCHHHE